MVKADPCAEYDCHLLRYGYSNPQFLYGLPILIKEYQILLKQYQMRYRLLAKSKSLEEIFIHGKKDKSGGRWLKDI